MPFEIRPPKIDAPEPMRQIAQVKSFLIQLVEQLNIALRTLESGATATSKSETPATTPTVPIAFNEIKALIIKSNDIIDAYYKKMSPKIENTLSDGISAHDAAEASHADIRKLIKELEEKVDSLPGGGGDIDTEELAAAIEEALRIAKESGDFDGADGVSCTHSWNGTTLTVTSASGTSSADLKGGKGDKGEPGTNGADGYTPVKGTDYYTEADKAEMVDLVLAALPTWNGGSY
jgi:hypothetical protein